MTTAKVKTITDEQLWGETAVDPPKDTARRVIKIAAIPESAHHSYGVIALCEDGTIWEAFFGFDAQPPCWGEWEEIPAIPGLTTK